ncbi:MAG: FHA domain-containing protein [Negativicutes bacterium]|nr:FHA domain-containing protein [Negativicutes bacterium]
MPGKIFSMVGIFLQYTLVILLYYFLYKVVRMIYLDLLAPGAGQNAEQQPFSEYKPEQARLVVLEGAETGLTGNVFRLTDTLTMGRSEHNDIKINDGYTSHEHACITKIKKNFWLYDLNSTNGTFLNGQRLVKEEMLKSGDIIRVGTVAFRFER